ncbi:MAG: T9SS type A sorting domain-containing protein [Bacteroidota bacterium]
MLRNTFTFIGTCCFFLLNLSFAQVPLWLQSGGGKLMDEATSLSISDSGFVYACGVYSDTAIFQNDTFISGKFQPIFTDIWIGKYSPEGNQLWVKSLRAQFFGTAFNISPDAVGGFYLTGRFQGTLDVGTTTLTSQGQDEGFLARFRPDGTLRWAIALGGKEQDAGLGLASDLEGNAYVTGYFTDSASFNGPILEARGGTDIFIAKFDSSGFNRWVVQAGGNFQAGGTFPPPTDQGIDLAIDNEGNGYLTGTFADTARFDTLILTNAPFATSAFVAKFDTLGTFMWATSLSSTAEARGNSIDISPAGNLFVAGEFSGQLQAGAFSILSQGIPTDLFVASLDTNGQAIWLQGANGKLADRAQSLQVSLQGGCWVTGGFQDTLAFDNDTLISHGGTDIFLAQFTDSGVIAFVENFGRLGNDQGNALGLKGNDLFLGGAFSDTFQVPGILPDTSKGMEDAFITRFRLCQQVTVSILGDSSRSFCQGDSVTLASQFPLSDSIRLQWLVNQQQILLATDSSIITSITGGYQVAITDTFGCADTSEIVTVQALSLPPKPVIAADSIFCAEDSLLVSGPTGFSNYQWSSGDSTNQFFYRDTLPISLVVVDSNGCVSASSDTLEITRFPSPPLPVIGGDPFLCLNGGGNAELIAPPGFAAYQWSTGDTTQSLSINGTGTVTLVVFDSNGCRSPVAQVDIRTQNPPATPSIQQIAPDTLQVTPPSDGYIWLFNGVPISDSTRKIVPDTAGTFQVIIQNNGCLSDTSAVFIYMLPVGIASTIPIELTIFPNPVKESFRIRTNAHSLSGITVQGFDANGQQVVLQPIEEGKRQIMYTVGHLSPGRYYLKVFLPGFIPSTHAIEIVR